MIFSSRHFLVSFLVLLQFIAPLVHAHTGEKFSSHGLHIPGLEVYAQSVSTDRFVLTPTVNALSCDVASFCSHLDGQIVGVDAGFSREVAMQRLCKIIADLDFDVYLPAHSPALKTNVASFATLLPPQFIPPICTLAYSTQSPRAPPALVIS